MHNKISAGLYSVVLLNSFTVFPEYLISVSIIYVLIVMVLVTYNSYGLMIQKAMSQCIALTLFMACYLIINDDLISLSFLTFHNSIVNDYLGFFTKFIVCFSSAIYFLIISTSLKEQRLTSFEYLIITLFAVLGLILLCSSNDLLTAYLAIELSSFAFYLLASFKKSSNYSVESGIKYFITGAISSAFFLLGSSFIYGFLGSINIHTIFDLLESKQAFHGYVVGKYPNFYFDIWMDYGYWLWCISYFIPRNDWLPLQSVFDSSFAAEVGLAFICFSLYIKLALAPFHLWSLDVYEGSPTSTTFFFAVISKLSIFVLLVRLCYVGFGVYRETWQFYSFCVGLLSIFVGSFGGLKQRKLKTLLAYSSTAHMGYSLIVFGSNSFFAIQMLFFSLVVYIIAGLCTWAIILLMRLKKKGLGNKYNKELGDLVSLKKSNPALAFSFALTMFSVAGIPPMLGFLSKMSVFLPVMHDYLFVVALISVLLSVVSTFYYIRVIKVLYFENTLVGKLYYSIDGNQTLLLSLLMFSLVLFFLNPTLLYLLNYKITLCFIF